MKKTIWIYQLLILGLGLILVSTNSCKKDGDSTPTVKDIDGNIYHTVKIGSQVWMVENLKTTHYRDGTSIQNVTDGTVWHNLTTGAYCNYNNDANNPITYGRLYNWYAVRDSRNIAPTGWHVPSDVDWTTLTNYLGGEDIAGGKLKEAGIWHWGNPNTEATNKTGFTALPGGWRSDYGIFVNVGYLGCWWSSTENDTQDYAWSRYMHYTSAESFRYKTGKNCGFSVRCVKD